MANRIHPRLSYIIAMPNYGHEALDGLGAYLYFAETGGSPYGGHWTALDRFAERFDSLRDAMSLARLIPGAFVATLLPSAD